MPKIKVPKSWFFRELKLKMWTACNRLVWGTIGFLILISILDFLLFQESFLELIILNLACISLILFSFRILAKILQKPTLLLHLVLLVLTFLFLYSITISNLTGKILYLTMLAISYISFNTIAIWKPSDALLQFLFLGALLFCLDYLELINVKELLLIGGYTTFSLCAVSIAFPSIKSLSLKDQIEEEYSKSKKILDFKSANQNLNKEIESIRYKISYLENKAKIYRHDLINQLGGIESLIELIELEDRYISKDEGDDDELSLIKKTLKDSRKENEKFFKNFKEDKRSKESIYKVNLNLHQLIKENIKKFYEKISSRNIQIELELIANEYEVHADETLLNTAFYNILKYIIEFSKNNDSINIITRNESKLLIFEFVNRNSGMSMIELESFFKNINVYDFEDIQNHKGLGLTIAKKNIELMDGNLRYSASKSLGFEFILEFQLND